MVLSKCISLWRAPVMVRESQWSNPQRGVETCHPVVKTLYLDPLSVSPIYWVWMSSKPAMSPLSRPFILLLWNFMRIQTVDGHQLGLLNWVMSAVCHSSFSSTLTQVAFIPDSLKLDNSGQCVLSALILVYLHHIFTACQAPTLLLEITSLLLIEYNNH